MFCYVKPRNLVEPVMFFYMLLIFLQFPAIQMLFYSKICLQKYNETVCTHLTNATYKQEETYVQQNTSRWILFLNLSILVPSIFSAMVLGRIGDTASRKWTILSPLIGQFICSIIYIVNAYYIELDPLYLLIGPLINGLMGGFTSFLMAVFSYLSHTTEKKGRTVRMGILEAVTFFAATIGFLLVGVLLDNFGHVVVFGIICGLACVSLLYTIFVIEDITPEIQLTKKELFSMIFSVEGFRNFINFFRKTREGKQKSILVLGLLVICIVMFILSAEVDLNLLYLLHPPLSMSKTNISYFLAWDNVAKALPLIILLPLFKKCFKINDCFWGLLGIISKSLGCVFFGSSHLVWLIFCVPVVRMFQGYTSAVIRSLLSSLVENDEQGQLFAVVASSESLITIVASLIFNPLYAATVEINPGISYYIAAGMGLIAAVMIVIIWKLTGCNVQYKNVVEVTEDTVDERTT